MTGSFDFHTLYLELIDSTGMIQALLAGISPTDARLKPSPDSWSIVETIGHLLDEERSDFRPRLDAILNRPHEEWAPIDPEGWVRSRKYNEKDLNEIKERFFTERSASLDWLKGLEAANWDASHTSQHGTMTAGDMFASWVAHDNLAIRQLVELRRARLEQLSRPYSIEYAGEW